MLAYRKIEDPLRLYTRKDCIEVFCNHIEKEAKRLYHMFPEKSIETLTLEQWREFSGVREFHICIKCFELFDKKVRDHSHYTGKYRGTIFHYIPIIFLNLSGYDVHPFIRELGKKFDSGSISVISENKEKYISFNVNATMDKYETPLGKKKQIKITR